MITYITPTLWQRREFLLEAEKSLAAQTFTDIDWIILSDKQPLFELAGLVQTHIIVHKDLTNVSKARNYGIALSNRKYIAFLDDDNLKCPDFGQQMIDNIAGFNAIFCFAITFKNNKDIGVHHISTVDYDLAWTLGNFYFTEEMFIERDFFPHVGFFDETLNASEDYDLALAILKLGKVKKLEKALTKIRQHDGQLIKTDVNIQTQFAMHRILKRHNRLSDNCFVCNKDLKELEYPDSKIKWFDTWRRVCEYC